MVKRYLVKMVRWVFQRLSQIPEKDRTYAAWFIFGFLIATTAASIIEALGNPTGASLLSQLNDSWNASVLNGFYFLVWTIGIGALLSFLYLPLPRLFLGSFSYMIFSSVAILLDDNSGDLFSYIVGIGYSLVSMLVVFLFILLFNKKGSRVVKLSAISAVLVFTSYLVFKDTENEKDGGEIQAVAATYTNSITDENPAEKGDYAYTFLTYGSGDDLHRKAFGEDVDIRTQPVDVSNFITDWSKQREAFWGFDPSNLPVNGRVWVPEGDGPFPIILMVHGNHTMEYFSTSGYDYVGEVLASRGFLAISVDEDFINYSNTSGIPNDNYELRARMLIEHLAQLQEMNRTPGHSLHEKIDFDQVGLVGHSRGGQAVGMVADYDRFFDDERLLDTMESVKIKGVVALAPTDKKIDGKRPHLDNVSYLLLQGARDGDVNNFRGDRQFYRTTLDEDGEAFKATAYIADANHSQFNTEWGRMDSALPRGLFLNRMQMMDPEDQRQLAKVYISAFFEKVLHGEASYEQLFRDYRHGKDWLPDTTLVSKYQNSTYTPIIQYDEDKEHSAFAGGITTDAQGFNVRKVITPEDRRGNNRPVDALQLEWEDRAEYIISFPESYFSKLQTETIVLTMANMNGEGEGVYVPDIEIELETSDGVSVQLPLEEFMPFPPVISTNYTPFGLMDDLFQDGKYENSWEPIFQTFELPIEQFQVENPKFNKDNLTNITLHFTTHPGEILLEEVGSM